MVINNLALNNYRNYLSEEISFSEGINILYGDNAQGKTNILEAIYMLATTKSHRTSKDKEIINLGFDEGHIKASVNKRCINYRIDMHLRKNKSKGVAIDQVPVRKTSQLMGMVNVVLFSPEDLDIIKDGPSERRRFIDMELCQLNKIYYSNLSNYNKILNQRNNLLKNIYYDKSQMDMLDVWDAQLVDFGIKIIKDRNNFIDKINEIILDIHKRLTGDKEIIAVKYDKNVTEEEFAKELSLKRDIDLRYQNTQVGPHRDDICFVADGALLFDARSKHPSVGDNPKRFPNVVMSSVETIRYVDQRWAEYGLGEMILSPSRRYRKLWLSPNAEW